MKMLDFPSLRQTYDYDCGAKALQAVLAYFGIELKEETIMKEAKTSVTGTSIINIEKTAKKHGLNVDSRKMTITDVKSYIDKKLPVILLLQAWHGSSKVNWEKDWNDGHYVVAIGYDKKKIYFEDPYTFKRAFLTFNELLQRWHDIIQNKKYVNHGLAFYGKKPQFNPQKLIHMD